MTSAAKSCTMRAVSNSIYSDSIFSGPNYPGSIRAFYYTGPYTSALMANADQVRERLAPARRERFDRQIGVAHRALSLSAWRLLELGMQRLGITEFRLTDVAHPTDAKPSWSNSRGIDFSVSHSKGMAFCVIGHNVLVGCDAEERARMDEKLTKRLLAVNAPRTPCWTEIESIVKAAGKGIMHGTEIIWRDNGGEFDGQSWWCYPIHLSSTHAMHVAANKPNLELITTEVVDL